MATLTYKGYTGIMEVDLEAAELFGRTLGMRDLITFQGKTIEQARQSFQESVEFYLDCCRNEGKPPTDPTRVGSTCGSPRSSIAASPSWLRPVA